MVVLSIFRGQESSLKVLLGLHFGCGHLNATMPPKPLQAPMDFHQPSHCEQTALACNRRQCWQFPLRRICPKVTRRCINSYYYVDKIYHPNIFMVHPLKCARHACIRHRPHKVMITCKPNASHIDWKMKFKDWRKFWHTSPFALKNPK